MKLDKTPRESVGDQIGAKLDRIGITDDEYREFATRLHGRGHFDAEIALGADLRERYRMETIYQLMWHMDTIPIPNSREEWEGARKEHFRRERKAKTATVEWFLEHLQSDDPVLFNELLVMGADMSRTEYVQTIGSNVYCDFYTEDGIAIALVIWDVSEGTFDCQWY